MFSKDVYKHFKQLALISESEEKDRLATKGMLRAGGVVHTIKVNIGFFDNKVCDPMRKEAIY